MTTALPEFAVDPEVLSSVKVELQRFGQIREARNVRFISRLPDHVEAWCLAYEEILRRIFRECHAFRDTVFLRNGKVILNSIDEFTSSLITTFLTSPSHSNLRRLFDVLRHFRGSPDIVALIVCRNRGIECLRLVTDAQLLMFCEGREKELSRPFRMPTSESRRSLAGLNSAYYVAVMLRRPVLLFGQASPYTPAIMRDFLGNKAGTSKLLRMLGYNTPEHILLDDDTDLRNCGTLGDLVIFKPVNDSNRVGVVGPVESCRGDAMKASYEQCLRQISNGPHQVLCERYIHGKHFRINVNHSKVTFVAKSIPSEILGDGASSVRHLLNEKRTRSKCRYTVDETYIENLLVGQGLALDSTLVAGRRLPLSHDGNEEGYFEDVTDAFPEIHLKTSLRLAEDLRCPVVGLDVIVDSEGTMWIVDVNSNPGIDFFGSPKRAYETMEHMIETIVSIETDTNPSICKSRRWPRDESR